MNLGQHFTPAWAAELLVRRHFPELGPGDTVIDPGAGDGRFLMAVPPEADALGVELDPDMAELARSNSGREVVTGDFRMVSLPRRPTAVIGNPPFDADAIDGFLDRCWELLDYDQRAGLLLPVYMFQTAGRVMRYQRRWSLTQELVPRNLFPGLHCPIMWANFTKQRRTVLAGLYLYAETAALDSLKKDVRALMVGNQSRPHCWREAVDLALRVCGGRATLSQIYQCLENNRPTDNPWWREKIRQVAQKHYTRVGRGEYALEGAA